MVGEVHNRHKMGREDEQGEECTICDTMAWHGRRWMHPLRRWDGRLSSLLYVDAMNRAFASKHNIRLYQSLRAH